MRDDWQLQHLEFLFIFDRYYSRSSFLLGKRRLKVLQRHAIASGLIYGVAVYTFMNCIVLPLSAYHVKIALPSVKDVTIHMFLVGLPISLVVRRCSDLGPAR